MELTKYEQDALDGKKGEALEIAYRILTAVGDAMDATKLITIKWVHVSGVNYNTIGDAGMEFLSNFSKTARTRVMTTLNPTGYDVDKLQNYDLDENFIHNQERINNSYVKMGVTTSFSCIPYDIYKIPSGAQVAFAESNAAIHANSIDNLKTNKESAFSALASAITGKSICSNIRNNEPDLPEISVQCKFDIQNELECGILGYFVGQTSRKIVNIDGSFNMDDDAKTKSLCGGIGTSGQCAKYTMNNLDPNTEKIDFDKKDFQNIHDKLNTADDGDVIAFGSPQLGLNELLRMSEMLKNKKFTKPCMIFCPRTVKNQANVLGCTDELEHTGCEILSDCCICFTPLLTNKNLDSVITNSIKGSYYLNSKNKICTNIKPMKQIINENTKNR